MTGVDQTELVERLARIETELAQHIAHEQGALDELREAIETLTDTHAQARGAAKALAWAVAVCSALGGAYAWIKAYVVFR